MIKFHRILPRSFLEGKPGFRVTDGSYSGRKNSTIGEQFRMDDRFS